MRDPTVLPAPVRAGSNWRHKSRKMLRKLAQRKKKARERRRREHDQG